MSAYLLEVYKDLYRIPKGRRRILYARYLVKLLTPGMNQKIFSRELDFHECIIWHDILDISRRETWTEKLKRWINEHLLCKTKR